MHYHLLAKSVVRISRNCPGICVVRSMIDLVSDVTFVYFSVVLLTVTFRSVLVSDELIVIVHLQ